MAAVVGAKLSEGLNLTDELARAVVIIGLPYPNLASTELKERLKFVSELGKHHKIRGNCGVLSTRDAGSEFYENLCMRAVNQSIGKSGFWFQLLLICLVADRYIALAAIKQAALYDIVMTGRP